MKKHGFQESRIKPPAIRTEDFANEKMRYTLPGFERGGIGALDSMKKSYENSLSKPNEYEESSANRYRKTTGAPFEEFRGFRQEFNGPNVNIMSPKNGNFDRRNQVESAKRSGIPMKNEGFQWDRPLVPHESVKRAMISHDPSIMDKQNLVSQIEILEEELRRMRDQTALLEGENHRAKGLLNENERLLESVKQYRSSISNFAEIERNNHELLEENSLLKRKLHEFEGHFNERQDFEARIEGEFNAKMQGERVLYEKNRREIEQLRGLEEKFYTIQAEKMNLEEEIEKIRMIKITLESQLEKLRTSYQEIEEEITIRVRREYEARISDMGRKMEGMGRELMEKEAKIRGNFDRELLELNAINRDLTENLGRKEEKLKKNGINEKFTMDLKEKSMRMTEELTREKVRNSEIEGKLRNCDRILKEKDQNFERILREKDQSFDRILKEKDQAFFYEIDKEKQRSLGFSQELETLKNSVNPEKELLFEKVVQELEKVNAALRALQIERDSLKRELLSVADLTDAVKRAENERDLLKKELLQGRYEEKEDFNRKIAELLRNYNQMKGELEGNLREKEGILREKEAALREKEVFQMKCGDLSAKLQEYENLSANLHEKVKKNGFEGEKTRRFLEEIQRENSVIKSENSQIKVNFETILREKEAVFREKEGIKREKDELSARIRESEGVYQRFNDKKSLFEEENRGLQAEKKDLMTKINEISRNLSSQIDINRSFKEKELKESQLRSMEKKGLIDQILQLSNELEGWKVRFSEEKQDKAKKAQISQFNQEKERDLRESIRKLEAENEALRRKGCLPVININENDVRMKFEAMITSLETKIMTLEFERDEFKGKIEEISRENRGLRENIRFLEENGDKGEKTQILGFLKEIDFLKAKQFVRNLKEFKGF